MQDDNIRFLPYVKAMEIVVAIQEEEDLDEPNRRILTVYGQDDQAICWFDFDEVMRDAGIDKKTALSRQAVTEYVLRHIPEWVLDE